jgi:hypothetical protein
LNCDGSLYLRLLLNDAVYRECTIYILLQLDELI